MYLNIIECDRCQKRSEDPSDSKSYVYIQWYVDEKGRKELHLCPQCARVVAEQIVTPRFSKRIKEMMSPLFFGDYEHEKQALFDECEKQIDSYVSSQEGN